MSRGPCFVVYQDKDHWWRWWLQDANGLLIATSNERFTRCGDAERAAQTAAYSATCATYEVRA